MTIGISPKVTAFLAAVGGPGILLIILGLILGDADVRNAGLILIGGAGAGTAAGYKAPPGEVVIDRGPASDALLPPKTFDQAAEAVAPGPLDELELEE